MKYKSGFLKWFYGLPLQKKQFLGLFTSEVISIIGLAGVGALLIVSVGRSQLTEQAESELAVTEINYNIKINQMGFGFRGQSDNTAIIAASNAHFAGEKMNLATQKQVKQILQNEIKAREIEYATLVGHDLQVIANANADRSGEIFNPNNLVSEVIAKPRQIKTSEIVSGQELAKESPPMPSSWKGGDALIRYTVTPVLNPQTKKLIGVLVSGDVVNSKKTIVKDSLLALGGGYSAVYLRKSTGTDTMGESSEEFALAVAEKNSSNQQQANPSFDYSEQHSPKNILLPDTSILTKAVKASGKTITQRMKIEGLSYTIAAKSLSNSAGEPVAVLVRGTSETVLNNLLKGNLLLQLTISIFALAADVLIAILLGRAIAQPIRNLQKTTEEFSEGNLTVRAEVLSTDEIGQLALTFNQMADKTVTFLHKEQANVKEQQLLNNQLQSEIAERQQAEVELRHALAKEQELNELRSRFISITSHEFRTPLTTILSSTELLRHYSDRWNEKKKLLHFERISSTIVHMTQMLDDILLIGKAEAGKLEFKPAPLDVVNFCTNLVEELQGSTGKQHNLVFRGECQCLEAQMDKKLLRHILTNLLSNAIKYSAPGSTVNCELSCHGENAIFRIQDQGIGIPEEDQKSLFELFRRAGNVGTTPGTGLGLAIVQKAVEVHNGSIMMSSKVGQGTTFLISLPLQLKVDEVSHV
ncbi:MAG: HAMP domain-containing sensor histidine kinase [Coleofasciculaceae cyanobacterium]